MYFETAGIEVAPWIPPIVALVVSFLLRWAEFQERSFYYHSR